MAFSVTPSSFDFGTIETGTHSDLAVTFQDVPVDVGGTFTVPFQLGGANATFSGTVLVDHPDVTVGEIVVPPELAEQGISVSVLDLTNEGATIRVSRA